MFIITMADGEAKLEEEFQEFNEIEQEIKAHNADLRRLRARKKVLHESITKYLQESKQPGFICGSSIVFVNDKPKRLRKKKVEKETSALEFLKSKGISMDTKMLNELLESMRGEKVSGTELKVKSMQGKTDFK